MEATPQLPVASTSPCAIHVHHLPLCILCVVIAFFVSQAQHVTTHAAHSTHGGIPPQRVRVAGEGWLYEIMDTREVDAQTRLKINLITLACVHGIGTLSLLHFMYGMIEAHADSYLLCRCAFITLQLFGLLPAYLVITSLCLSRSLHEASAYAPHHTYFLQSAPNPIIITQRVARACHITRMDVRLECMEVYQYVNNDGQRELRIRSVYQQNEAVARAKEVRKGHMAIS